MKHIVSTLVPVLAWTVAISGCREDTESATAPETTPALASASAAVLSFRQVSAGGSHTCGLTTENLAYCWGANGTGQLGDGSRTRRLRPVAVAGGHRFVLISAGGGFGSGHTCAVTSENRAYCWGNNNWGQLGDGTLDNVRLTPRLITGFRFRQIRAGFLHTCGITPTDVAFCWGNGTFGMLGTGTSSTPTPTRVARGLRWIQVIAGAAHTCGVTTARQAYCWGNNEYGQLGDGTRTNRNKPAAVAGGLSFRQVVPGGGAFLDFTELPSADEGHTCGLATDDKAYCWGLNLSGELGHGTAPSLTPVLTPKAVVGGRRFRQINAGRSHTCAVNFSNLAFCWGGGPAIGTGTSSSTSPARVAGGLTFNAVTAGALGQHSCAWTTTNRRAFCWGLNNNGQLGDGTTTTRSTPVAVLGPS